MHDPSLLRSPMKQDLGKCLVTPLECLSLCEHISSISDQALGNKDWRVSIQIKQNVPCGLQAPHRLHSSSEPKHTPDAGALFSWLNFKTSFVTPVSHQCHALISRKLGLVSDLLSLRKRKVGKSVSNDSGVLLDFVYVITGISIQLLSSINDKDVPDIPDLSTWSA